MRKLRLASAGWCSMSGGSRAEKAIAQLMAVSVSSVQKAGKIRRDGIPELEAAIAAGRATIGAAYWLAMNAAPETQRWALG